MVYPWMKRVTHWPQEWLGIAVNWNALLGWVAIEGTLDLPIAGALMLGLFAWTLFYDTTYAIQDRIDDAKIGVGLSVLAMANNMLYICASVLFGCLTAVGILDNRNDFFFAISVVATSLDLFSQVKMLDVQNSSSYAGDRDGSLVNMLNHIPRNLHEQRKAWQRRFWRDDRGLYG
ncbi:hypothetical protein B0H16DRAFT_1724176 [Mycena metata]|uniref:Uncharacterized protein n=1 Tax=Mycena metata TaxID=1033252 RepID=A0AAD7IYR7_9AGAR|nr:hypothetical protein B0H16DRAFT_1724176 [Mycena metata]